MSICVRLLLSLTLFAGASQAATITLNATDSGHHSSGGNHTASNESYAVGWANEELRNFFVFDLSGLPTGETILSATLVAYNPADDEPDASYDGGYQSEDATETYELREVLLAASVVTAPSVASTTVYDDLGDGAVFGSATASLADNGQNISVSLNASGVAQLQTFAGVGSVVLGGRIDTLLALFGSEEAIWVHTDPPNGNQGSPYTRQLVLQITPEPGSGLLLGLGLVGIAARRRARARRGDVR